MFLEHTTLEKCIELAHNTDMWLNLCMQSCTAHLLASDCAIFTIEKMKSWCSKN